MKTTILLLVSGLALAGCTTTPSSYDNVGFVSYVSDTSMSCSDLHSKIGTMTAIATQKRQINAGGRNARLGLALVQTGNLVASTVGSIEPLTGLAIGAAASVLSSATDYSMSANSEKLRVATNRRERLIAIYESNC